MKTLSAHLAGLAPAERDAFAHACGTSLGYLRKALSTHQRLGESLCINIERESHGRVPCEDLRPDVDWAYLRGTAPSDAQREVTQ